MHSVLPIRNFNDHTCNLSLSHISSGPNPKTELTVVSSQLCCCCCRWCCFSHAVVVAFVVYCCLSACYLFMVNLHTQPSPMLLLITFLYLFYPKFIGHRAQTQREKWSIRKNQIQAKRWNTHIFISNWVTSNTEPSRLQHLRLYRFITRCEKYMVVDYYVAPERECTQQPKNKERRRRAEQASKQRWEEILIFWSVDYATVFFISMFIWELHECLL